MPTTQEIDAAFRVAQIECHWSINKLGVVERMLRAAEHARDEDLPTFEEVRDILK